MEYISLLSLLAYRVQEAKRRKGAGSSTYGNENTPLAPSESRSQRSADGRMATGAGLAEWEQTHGKKKAKCVLTSTGLLMEGVEGFWSDSKR
jgi:hypothetical protein